jgi:glucans biosynthesis protein
MPPLLGTVLATRVGRVLVEPPKDPPNLRFVIDFGGASLEALTAKEKVSSEIDLGSRVELVDDALIRIEANNTWRLVIEVVDPRRAFDLRAQLRRRGKPITETWTFTWQP